MEVVNKQLRVHMHLLKHSEDAAFQGAAHTVLEDSAKFIWKYNYQSIQKNKHSEMERLQIKVSFAFGI